jgi:drug/metabolite transporter (DMT)-like permease
MPLPAHARLTGPALILVAAASFGLMPLFSAAPYRDGISPPELLSLRFALASPLLWTFVLWRRLELPRGRTLLTLIAMGMFGYAGVALCYFWALTLAPGVVVALLLYLYPAFVVILCWPLLGERPSGRRLLALGLALAGCALTIGYAGGAKPLGVLLGIVSGIFYALYTIAGRTLPTAVPALVQSAVVSTATALSVLLLTLPQGPRWPQSPQAWAGALGLALVSTVIGISAYLAGLRRLGPARAAVLSTFEPVVTALVGAALLAEPLGSGTLAGGALILVACVLVLKS